MITFPCSHHYGSQDNEAQRETLLRGKDIRKPKNSCGKLKLSPQNPGQLQMPPTLYFASTIDATHPLRVKAGKDMQTLKIFRH